MEVPERPEGPLEIFNVTDTRAQLQWYPPRDAGGGPIIGYIIDARELDKIDIISHLELVPPTCTSAVIEGLETGQLYQFRVYSENAAGMSDALIGPRSVRIQAGIARPSCPGVPVVIPRQGGDAFQQLAYSSKPDDAVILQWAAPYTDGGTPVNGYAVERKAGASGQWVRAHPLDVRETEVALTGLQPGQDYRFRVKASNAIGWSEPGSESESYLVPYDPSNVVRPSFTVGLRDAIVMEHEKVEFVVEVQGIPPPEVQWVVNASTDAKVIVTDRDPDSGATTLVVNDVLACDEGEVKCIATNEAGQSTSSAILSVEAPPRAVLTKKYEDGLIFEEGDIIRLKVEFTGRPRPEITWYHENKLLAPDGRMEIEIMADCTILKVAQAKRSDRGEYSVKLQSGLGEDSASFLVTVANRPSVPGKPEPVNVLESVVSLQWAPSEDDGGCEISCYIVEYNRLGWDMWLKAATSRTPQIRLGDLIPGSTYLFRIKAENPYGVSEPSAQSDLIRLPARSNETSWVPDMTSSELVDPDDTTISSSNLGPRDSDQQVTRSGEFDYLPLDASELEMGRLTDPSILGAPPAFEVMGGVALMSEPPDRPGQVELDPRYAFSASAVLEKMAAPVTLPSLPGLTSNDVLSGIGSSTSRISSSPSVSPERPSLEDALSLDDDSSEGSSHDVVVQQLEAVEQPIVPVQQRGFLLPRSPARLFVHNAVVQSALSSVASSSAPVTLSDVLEQVALDDAVADSQPSTLDQIEQDIQDQLQVLDQIEVDISDEKEVVQNEVAQSNNEMSSSDQTDQILLEQETVMEQIKPSDQLALAEQHVGTPYGTMESPVAKESDPPAADHVDVPTILLQEEEVLQHDVPVRSHLAAIDSGVCELMAHRGSDGEGQHTDQYSDAYITAVDSMSSCDYGDSPEPDGVVLDRHAAKGECPSPPISSKQPIAEMDADVADTDAAIGTDGRPIFLRCVTDQTVKVGTRARFLAEIVSSSSLAVTWFFNGLPVFQPAETAHGRFKILHEGNFYCLEISPVALEDEGAWTCRAVLAESFGSEEGVSATAQLRVMVPKSYKRPEFVEDLQAILTEEGTVSLECKVVGIPTPVLHWFKDGKEIKAGDVFAFRAPQSDSTAEETATSLGIYSCEAINCIGKAVSTSQVRVKNAAQQPTQSQCESAGPPVIIEEPFSQKIRVGEDVRFSVRVMVPPKPVQVKWFNKDVPKETSSKYVLGEDGHGGYSLDICPTDINDDGEWKVAIKNEGVDAESSASAVLTLVVPKNYRPPRFLESLKAILTEEGLVSFECKVVGFPTPQLQWFKDGQELKPGDVYQLSGTNSLGSYSCVARNCMGTAISAAELTVDDIQNQLNEEERLQLMDSHRPPVFAQGLRSSESRVGDPLRLTVQVSSTTENFLVTWFHNDEPIDLDETHKYRSSKEEAGLCHLDVEPLEFSDEGDWKCIVINDFGHAVTSCSVKLTVPRFFRKPHFLEPLRAVLSDEGTVNLECKVIGVPQPSLKWYKDGVELKPGDIHRIMSGQDGTCCLGTYTCEAHNCMGTSSSSAALLGFEDRPEAEQNAALAHDETLLDAEPRSYIAEHPRIARNPSLSTIQEERSSQISLYETANAEDTLTEERAEISVSLDGREVSVSLYETPDLTEEEAQQIVELFAEELSERISYRNTTELPPLRFTRETATSGSLLMEAVVIDVPMEINGSGELSLERTLSEVSFEEAPTEADIEELSAMEALIIEEADQRNDPYFLDDLTIPDLPYEVSDVRRSITGLQEALLVHETCPSDREQPLHVESHSGGATPIVMSPRRLSIEHEEVKIVEDYQIVSADGIQSPADADYYSPLEYSDSCSVLLTSPKTDSPAEEAVCVATPTVQQPAVAEEPVVMAMPLSDVAETVPLDASQSTAKGKIEDLIVSNKSSLDIRESADETETSADENSQRRTSVVEALSSEALERKMPSAFNELELAEEVGDISMIETGPSNSVLVESKLSTIHLESDQTSGVDGAESGGEGDPSASMPSDGRIQVAEQDGVTRVEECWSEASRLAAAVDTVMDEAPVVDHGVELEQYPSTSSASNAAGRLLGSGQESDSKGQSFDTAKDEQEILSSADTAASRPAIGDAAHQGSDSNIQVPDVTAGSKLEQASAASSPIIAEQCSDVPPRFQEVDDRATKHADVAAELPGNVTSDTSIPITESEESCPTPQSEVKSDDEPVIGEELAPAIETDLADKAEEGAGVIDDASLTDVELSDKVQKEVKEELCLQEDAGEVIRIEKDVSGPEMRTVDAKESNQVGDNFDVKLEEDVIKNEIVQKAGEQKYVEKLETLKPEELKTEQDDKFEISDEQCQIKEEANQLESGNKNAEVRTNDVEIPAQPKEVKEDERFSKEVEPQEQSSIPAEEKEHIDKEVEMQDVQVKDEEQPTVSNVEDIQEKMDTRQHQNDEIVKEVEELLVEEAEHNENIQKQAEEEEPISKEMEEKERLRKEAEEKRRLVEEAKETERLKEEAALEQERLLNEAAEREHAKKEAEEQERLLKEAEENERLLQEAEEIERLRKEAEEKERLMKEAEENERLKKAAEEVERLRKELEAKERLAKEADECRLKEAEEKERLRTEAEEQTRLKEEAAAREHAKKEAEEQERLLKEAEENERLLKVAEERDRLEKAEENERIRKEAEEKERLLKESEENERLAKEAEEKERMRIVAEENERLLKEAEETERLLKEAEEKERLLKEAEANERRVKEVAEIERLKKEVEEAERLKKDAEEAERVEKEAKELLLQRDIDQACRAAQADEIQQLKQETELNEDLPKNSAEKYVDVDESLVKETGEQENCAENRDQESIEKSAEDKIQTGQISQELDASSSFLSSGALRSMDVSLPTHSEASRLMAEKSMSRTDSVDRQHASETEAEHGDLTGRKESNRKLSSALIESTLTEDELIVKQIEEEKQQRRRDAAEKLLREQEQQASGQADASARRHEERLRLEPSELHQTVDEHIRKQRQEEEVIQRESEEEKVRLQKQKEEERRIKLEEAEKLRREVEIQERQRREEKEAKRLEAERIQREKDSEEWTLKEQERIRLEEEIQRLESERLRMKEERRLRQAKEEEEERLRVKREREERLRREREEEERLRREEEEQLRLMKEERERARKQKEEEEERMLREIEERALKKKEENERLRKEKEEEERLKKEEERQRREEEERKRMEAAEKLRQEAEEKMREKEEKRIKQEEEKQKREEEEKRMKEELRKQKEEEAKKVLDELEAARIKRAEELKLMAEEEHIAERCVKQAEHIQPAPAASRNEVDLNEPHEDKALGTLEMSPTDPVEMKLRERQQDERGGREAASLRKEDVGESKEPDVKAKEDDGVTRQKEREEKKSKEVEEKERKEAEAKALMEQQERKKAEEKKFEEQQQEKERQAAEEAKRIEEEKLRREAEEKKRKEREEEERKEAEKLEAKQEKERKEAEQKKMKELQEAERMKLKEQREKEAEEKRLKEQAEKARKEREEKELKDKQEAEQRKMKELQEAEEKKLKEEAEKVRKEREEKELKEKERKEAEELKKLKEEKERLEAEERKKKEQEKKLKEAEELKKKEQQEKERREAEESKKKEQQEQQEKERKEAEEKRLKEEKEKERQAAEEKKFKEQKEKERKEAEEMKLKEQQEKERKERKKKKDKLEKERKEIEEKQMKEQRDKEAKRAEETTKSSHTTDIQERGVQPEEAKKRSEREAGRQVDDARNRSDDESSSKERRRRPITKSDEQTAESSTDNSARTTRTRARPVDESQFDCAVIGSATRRRPVPTVFEEAGDAINQSPSQQQPAFDGSSQTQSRQQLSTDFDLHPGARLSREDMRHGIRSRSAGVASHSTPNRSAYHAESHSNQPEWDSSTKTSEDGRRDPTKKPKFSSKLRDMEVAKGSKIKLTCSLLCNPEPEIEWFRNGCPILKCEDRHRYTTSWNPIGIASLEVRDLTRSDTGEYMCVARNQHGQASTSADVRVRGDYEPKTSSPSFTSCIRDTYHDTSDELVLECSVNGFPTPKITWMKDGIKLHLSSRYKHSLDLDGRCRLVVHSPCVGDSGQYTCVAHNASRKDEISSFVVVPEHVWNNNEMRMKTVPSHAGYSGSAEFYRRQAERDKIASSGDGHGFDAGRYDGMGVTDDSAHFVLLPESTLTVGRDRDLVIQCRVRGHPRPKVTWLKGIRDVAESGRSCVEMDGDLYRFVLKKANYGDGGTYIVKASNCHGTQKAYCTVRVKEAANSSEWDFKDAETSLSDLSERRVRRFNKDVPGPVAAPPMATVSGKNVVSLSWPKPNYTGGAPILAYKVEAWLLGEGAIWIEVAMTCITSTDVYNLKPDREYLFRITPRNKYGWGESLVSSTPIKTVSRTGLPHFDRPLQPQIKALEHTDVELLAEVTGEPAPHVEWYRDGSKLDGVRQPRYELRSIGSHCRHALTIHDVRMETDDDSKFTCEAVNPAGRVATFSRVLVVTDQRVAEADALFRQQLDGASGNDSVVMAPQFTMRPRDRRVQLTFPVRLTCQVIGHPKPDVTWYHNGSAIITGHDERHSYSVDGNFHTLEIAATKFDDAGIYSVQGRNCSGAVGCQCCLVVDGGIRAYVMPFFTHELEDRTVSEGGTFSLIARVEAYPAVGVLWHRDGIRLRPCRQYDMRLESDGTVALVVSGVLARRHAGVYTCTVTNEVGQVSSNARVTITQRPLAIPSSSSLDAIASDHDNTGETSLAPHFVQKPTEHVEGDSLVVVCEVLGDPKPEVIWLRDWLNARDNQQTDRFVSEADAPLYKLSVPCVQLDFAATYSVVARNVHGQAKAAVSLQVYVHGGGQGRQNSLETVGSRAPGRSTTLSRVLTAPTVVQPLRHLRCCDGDTVTFECRFNGQPETADSLQTHWLRGGKLLRSCKDFSTEVIAEDGVARLSIRRVYPEDEGEYTCVAYNGLGSHSTSACLIVDVADDKENDLMVQLDSRPAGTVSARATPRTTPRTTPSRTIRSVSPINSKATATQQQQQQQQQQVKSRVRKVPPKFYSVPHNKIAETGETVRFQCNVGGNPSPRVTWDRDNIAIKPETITPAGRVSIEERDDVRVLEIRNVTSEDAGLYRITVENELGRIQANARLDILSRSSGSRSSGFVRSGSAASAGRGAYYSPVSGSSAARSAARSLAMSGATYLRGTSTPRSGGGRYHATSDMDGSSVDGVAAKSKASSAKQAVSFVQQLPSRMRVNEGDVVELQVVITGTPPLKVVWVQNDVILADCPEFRHLDYGGGRYALRLGDAFTHDSGVYFCEAYNRYGEAESWCRLIVSDPADKLFAETSAEASTTLAYSSANTASIRTHNDEEDDDDDDGGGGGGGGNNKIENVMDGRVADYRDDEDVFSCSKEDLTYESDKLNDELDNPFQVAAQIVKGPVSVSTLVGSTVLLEALIIGRPEPTVRWLKGGKELVESDRVEMRQADGMASLSLHRITADDSGKYIVMAENTFGMDCHYASLAVEGPPDPGGKPTICEVKADSLTLTWYGSVYDGGSVITGYLVEICETGQSWRVLTSECNSTSYVIHGLAPLRTYQFRVRAKNIHGCSEPSSPSDPLHLQPPTAVEKRDKAVVVDRREEKDHQMVAGQPDDDRDDDDDPHAPQFEHCHVTVQPGEPHFLEKYSVHEELGKGRFGVVYRLVDRASGALRAAKYVRCIKAADREKVYQEVAVMNKLQHPKLLQLAAAYDCPKEIVLVTEYISGGELFERVVADDFTLTERDCILFMRQICEGVGYMHSKSIVHLDLKPENILCQSPNSHRIKLIDFGLARQLDPDQPVRVLFGTPEFIAPEIVSYEPIGCATDMWSLGVVCYVLLSGLSPFMGDNDADTFANITSSDYDFDDDAFAAISCDAKDFISTLLVKRPELRLSAEACLQHKWLAQAKHAMNSVKLPTDRLKKFIIRRKWQKTGTAIRALGRMASLSSASRRNSSSSSTGRRSSRMDSLCEEEQGSVFSSGSSSSRMATSSLTAPTNGTDPVTRIRSPSLPVVTHPCQSSGPNPGIARSRSPSLPATGPAIELADRSPPGPATMHANNSPRRVYYADRSDSGISDCSNHSSTLLSGSHMPALIQEEEDDEYCGTEMSALTNGCSSSDRLTGGTFVAQKSGGQHALKSKSVVSSRHSLDSAIGGE